MEILGGADAPPLETRETTDNQETGVFWSELAVSKPFTQRRLDAFASAKSSRGQRRHLPGWAVAPLKAASLLEEFAILPEQVPIESDRSLQLSSRASGALGQTVQHAGHDEEVWPAARAGHESVRLLGVPEDEKPAALALYTPHVQGPGQ